MNMLNFIMFVFKVFLLHEKLCLETSFHQLEESLSLSFRLFKMFVSIYHFSLSLFHLTLVITVFYFTTLSLTKT